MRTGQIIKDLMYVTEYTQMRLAKALKISQAKVSMMRNFDDEPDFKLAIRMVKLAKKYNMKLTLEDFIIKLD